MVAQYPDSISIFGDAHVLPAAIRASIAMLMGSMTLSACSE